MRQLQYWIKNIPNLPMMITFRILRRTLAANYDYAWGWHSNIAMAAYDEGLGHEAANRAAARFMHNCFRIDTSGQR